MAFISRFLLKLRRLLGGGTYLKLGIYWREYGKCVHAAIETSNAVLISKGSSGDWPPC